MKLFIPISILVLALSCKTEELATGGEHESSNQNEANMESSGDQSGYDSTFVAGLGELGTSDPVNIVEAKMIGNDLILTVEYSGGCQPHSFELIGNPVVMKSLPPKRVVKLIHHSNDDNCRMLIRKIFKIDVKNLSASDRVGNETILILEGYKGNLQYIKQ